MGVEITIQLMITSLQSASSVSGLLPEICFSVACPSYGNIYQSSFSTCSHCSVMKHLASQKRKPLGLATNAIVLQVITVEELQLVPGQL